MHDYDEDIDPCIDEYDDVMEYDDYSEESEDDEDETDDILEDNECNNFDKQSGNQEVERNSSTRELNVNYFRILGKQIFLGMVSMQYQPLVDMVCAFTLNFLNIY